MKILNFREIKKKCLIVLQFACFSSPYYIEFYREIVI